MDLSDAGFGAGGGILGAFLTFLGISKRMDSQDKRIEALEEQVIYKDTHAECSRAWHDALERVDNKLDILLSRSETK
jgi:hypothetical protein